MSIKKGHLFQADAGKTLQQFRENMAADIQDSRYTPEVERGILQFAEDVASKKVQSRAHPTTRLHAKIYLIIPKRFNEHKAGAASISLGEKGTQPCWALRAEWKGGSARRGGVGSGALAGRLC